MKYALALIFVLVVTIAEAACPVGSTCENYQGQIPYPTTNPAGNSPGRTPADRANDHGVNILEYGAVRNNISSDSTAAIQAAIDACYNQTGCREIFCPDGDYAISYPLFLDPPGSLRGGAPWVSNFYQQGDIVTQSGTYYRSTINGNNNTPPGTGWTTTPPPIYNAGSTYSIGDTVISSGMMWKSLANSNVGNTPGTLSTFWQQTVEQANLNANWGATFKGNLTGSVEVGTGCRFFVLGGKNFPAMWIYGNGMVVDSLQLIQQSALHRCQLDPNLIGFAIAGGSSSLTTIRNSSVSSFYAGVMTAANGNPNVADSNYMERSSVIDACFGVWFPSDQNFLNTLLEDRIENTRYNVYAAQNNGVNVYGGNYTNGANAFNTFAVSGVSLSLASAPYRLTATITSPDANLTGSGCASTRTDYPLGCQYDVFVIVTPSFGAIPFMLKNGAYIGTNYTGNGFNSGTSVITLQLYQGLMDTWVNAWIGDAQAEIQAATVMYAAEMGTSFTTCGGNVNDLHLENFGVPTTIIYSECSFGIRPSWFKNIYLNYASDLASFASSPTDLPRFLAQATLPIIAAHYDLHVDGLNAGVASDRTNMWVAAGSDATFENSVIPLNIKTNQCISQSFSSVNTGSTVSCGIASRGFGGGRFGEAMGGGATSSLAATIADQLRGGFVSPGLNLQQIGGYGRSPFWGVRPAPYTSPCVTPQQFANIPPTGSLPTITSTGATWNATIASASPHYIMTVTSVAGTIVAGPNVYGKGVGAMFQVLAYGTDGTSGVGGTGTYAITGQQAFSSSNTFSTATFAVPFPLLWGGQNYRVCDWDGVFSGLSPSPRNFYSPHKFYSYGQDITRTINPGLNWSIKRKSPTIYLDPATLRLIFPGLILQVQCNGTTSDEMVVEVNQILGYARLLDANQDGSPYVTDFGQDCTGAVGGGGAGTANITLKQPVYAATQF